MQAHVFAKNIRTRRRDRQPGVLTCFEISNDYNILLCALRCRVSGQDLYAFQASTLFRSTEPQDNHETLTYISPGFDSEISSIQSTANGLLLVTSLGGKVPPEIQIHNQANLQPRTDNRFSISGIYLSRKVDSNTTLWCASANPHSRSSQDKVVLGTEGGLIELIYRPDGISDLEVVVNTSSDTLALSWMSANVISAGLRSGSVLLWDHRSRGSSFRLQHAGPVCALKRAETENHLLVAGMHDSFAMYDLRMPHVDFNGAIFGNKKSGFNRNVQRTRPFLQFSNYENSYRYPIGMDYCEELGIVAVLQDGDHIKFFSRHNGDFICSTQVQDKALAANELLGPVSEFKNSRTSSCLRFTKDSRDDIHLFSNREGVLHNYSW